ncbi:ERAD-associated E3 ubiquitin- ligase component HRD3A-like [Paramuricea clavata]|uniref:ERAD-associated E3 ubiquitin- ligase component HRD3A-like n=1 Tax=Paramuricea clavata TaxID=317549 RepID=A0A6S7JF16_PARCT|nr:ERAD-associated E3 ubiquitin- ligase component HRD3A-like [Paramuricea clavata]
MSETEMQEEGPRRRYKAPWSPDGPEYDPLLPYGPKVYLARKKKPDPWWIVALEVLVVVSVILFFIYMYYYIDHLHFHVTHAYARIGSSTAQHHVAHKYLRGHGTNQDHEQAMYWFRQAADNGHAGGAYNLVAAHFQGFKTDLQEHEIENMLKVAADGGHEEAKRALREMYPESY